LFPAPSLQAKLLKQAQLGGGAHLFVWLLSTTRASTWVSHSLAVQSGDQPMFPQSTLSSFLPVKSRKWGVISLIVAALHASRRRQARQILRRYEHLIAPAAQGDGLKQNSGGQG
jgi:hypothetical protein